MCRPNKIQCFKCFQWFDKEKKKVEHCAECGDYKCPSCNACLCDLNKKEQKIVMSMIHTYEKFIQEELGVKEEYDFSQHEKLTINI